MLPACRADDRAVHLLLTDRLICPRCGPAFGLILRADELAERRIRRGVLGCPNCRESYPIEGGIGDLRPEPRTEVPSVPFPGLEGGGEAAARTDVDTVQALLGLGGEIGLSAGVAQTVLVGSAARYAVGLAERLPDLEMVGVVAGQRPLDPPTGLSALVTERVIPLHERSVRGVLLEGESGAAWISAAARVVAPRNRVVVLNPPAGTTDRLEGAGLQLRLDAPEAVVAERNPGAPTASPGVAPLSGAR